jgi:predicted TIM-barrel fold metal-dependent hydrolase
MNARRVIDGDGHVHEDPSAIAALLPSDYQRMVGYQVGTRGLFPPLDNLHTVFRINPPLLEGRGVVDANGWFSFLDDVGIQQAVLYPSMGLAIGRVPYPEVAVALARAYNDWLYQTYVSRDSRFNGMGLIPLQQPSVAVAELRRVVTEYGFRGGLLPSNGLKDHLGARQYWPLYAEADRLGCCLCVHGGSHMGLGLDQLDVWPFIQGLGHPFGLMVAFAGIVSNGILDRYPNVRVGFLEGGVGWLLTCVERFDAACRSFQQLDLDGRFFQLRANEGMRDYLQRHIDAGRVFVGCEGGEIGLGEVVHLFGNRPFVYSSDFPHEVTNSTCKEEIQEVLDNPDLSEADKEAILHGNAESLYGIPPATDLASAHSEATGVQRT